MDFKREYFLCVVARVVSDNKPPIMNTISCLDTPPTYLSFDISEFICWDIRFQDWDILHAKWNSRFCLHLGNTEYPVTSPQGTQRNPNTITAINPHWRAPCRQPDLQYLKNMKGIYEQKVFPSWRWVKKMRWSFPFSDKLPNWLILLHQWNGGEVDLYRLWHNTCFSTLSGSGAPCYSLSLKQQGGTF